ncbi:agmatinase [Breoghania sp.]|uniref:agmatinase n=1 Tax=Breoghania sp. TaxID=2065378 RepID=UPI0029CA2FE7|nr:agmatinase [Breoghania sp.]
MSEFRPYPTDDAVFGQSLTGGSIEPAFSGVTSFMRRRLTRDLTGVDAVVWGIPFDASVSNRPGARFGPQAVRRASAILCGDPQYPFHADPFENMVVVDYGDCSLDYGHNERAPAFIEGQAAEILKSGAHLFSIGGDHFVTYPLLKAHAAIHGPLALVMFDAHQDTWDDKGDRIDHGTFVGRAVREGLIDAEHSIQIGIRTHAPETCGISIIHGEDVHRLGVDGVIGKIKERVSGRPAYMTFDIDCLDPAFAPGTGTPVSGGLSSREALMILRGLSGIGFVGGDVVEVAPAYDHADITAIAGSSVAQYYLGLLDERRKAGG